MTRMKFRPFVVWVALLALLMTAPSTTHATTADAEEPGVESEGRIHERVDEKLAERRQAMLQEAHVALDESGAALAALEEGKSDEALESLARATGKLELLIARDPDLALAPVDVELLSHDVYGTPEAIRRAIEQVEELLEDGNVQEARTLLSGLASEMVIRVQNLPLATYPAAIKAISPLIDQGRTEEAKEALRAALNTLVVTDTVIPLPVLRAQFLLDEAEALGKDEPSKEDEEAIEGLVADARQQLEMAKLLGYGSGADHQRFQDQIAELQKKIAGGEETSGMFATIRRSLQGLQSSFFN